MMRRIASLASVLCLLAMPVRGQEAGSPSPRVITLAEAVKPGARAQSRRAIAGSRG